MHTDIDKSLVKQSEDGLDKFTSEQRDAILAQGQTIVSASAGSGKTTVMIEKIIRFIKDGGDVNDVLAVTFTKKASSQMKEKLRKALIKSIHADETSVTERKRLKKQLECVPTADISTIHSFCARLIRTHFYTLGIDNTFRIINGDDAEGRTLRNEAIERWLEEGYKEKNASFNHLISVYWRKKSDVQLREILLTAHKKLMNRDDYEAYLQRSCEYTPSTFDVVCKDLHNVLVSRVEYYLNAIEDMRIYFEAQTHCPSQLEICQALIAFLETLLQTKTIFEAKQIEKPVLKQNRANGKMTEEDLRRKDALTAWKDKLFTSVYKELLDNIKDEETEKANFMRSAQTASALAQALSRFDELYTALKAEKNVLDYNDLEHVSLKLLQNEEVVKELREKYRRVFVDEYQDVSPVQEAILSKVAGEEVFLVGDVKQSIYGFRGSKSKFFVEKRKAFKDGGKNDLIMRKNFRSADVVLDAVNRQFVLAMTPNACNIDYAREAVMEKGGLYPKDEGRVQVHFLPKEKKERQHPRLYSVKENEKKTETESRLPAKLLKDIILQERRKTYYDTETKTYRPVRYADIAVLTRNMSGKELAETITSLSDEGIPVTTTASVNVCEYGEIKTLIDILSLIDNACQDIPLCSALLSTMGNLTVDDLTCIRLTYPTRRDKEVLFREACKLYAEEKQDYLAIKLRSFYVYFEELRTLSSVYTAGEILTKIITDTRMEARLLSRDNSEACLRRINRFIEETYAEKPMSVHAFLAHLKNVNYEILYSENGGEDSVKVMTMHSSKGLEYPVVILNDLSAGFKGADNDEVLLEEEYGVAPNAFNETAMTKSSTLLRLLCRIKHQESSVLDELNLYYVALTRAKFSLHVIFKEPALISDVRYAKSFADFTDFSIWENYVVEDILLDEPKQERTVFAFNPDEEKAQAIRRAFTWEYAHTGAENLPVKSSASQLLSHTPYLVPEDSSEPAEQGLDDKTSVQTGLAYHAFLERTDFSALYTDNGKRISNEDLRDWISSRLETYAKGEEAEWSCLLDAEKLERILSNPIFGRLQGKRLYKEQKFLVSLPVSETYARYANEVLEKIDEKEEMIFQGAIDLLAIGDGEAWIIDYKDSVKSAEGLLKTYTPQLELYRMAVAKITKMPKEKVRCFIVNLHRGFQVDL